MIPLYIFEKDSVVKIKDQQICVLSGDTQKLIPVNSFSHITIFGNVQTTAPVIKFCLKNDRDIFFLGENGDYIGETSAIEGKNTELRVKQYRKLLGNRFKLQFAKDIILGKIKNQRRFLQLIQREKPDNANEQIKTLKNIQSSVDFAKSADSLLGIEGLASRTYFQGLKKFINPEFKFDGRNKFPPKDEINSMLSFSYTLLAQLVTGICKQVGLDVYLGFYHSIQYGRKSLVYDMMEEFRTICDRLVLSLVNKRIIIVDQFRFTDDGAVLMGRESIRKLIGAFAKKFAIKTDYMEQDKQLNYYEIALRQARKLKDVIYGKTPRYTPFIA